MKIAYYEENKYHTEIIGFLLEYIIYKNSTTKELFDIVIYNDKDMSNTLNYYKNKYKFKIKNNLLINQDINDYKYIFIGTSSNTQKIDQSILTDHNNRIIYICHLKDDIRDYYKNIIVLTPLNIISELPISYIKPIHNLIKYENDNKIIKLTRIVIIGRFKDNNRDILDLINLINNYRQYNFEIIICSRLEKFIPNDLINLSKEYPTYLKILIGLNSNELEKIIINSKFICPLISNNSWYFKDRYSGNIALSFNYNKPLIIQNKLKDMYEIQNCVSYNENISEIIEDLTNMSNEEYNNVVNNLYKEKIDIINANNLILNNIFK